VAIAYRRVGLFHAVWQVMRIMWWERTQNRHFESVVWLCHLYHPEAHLPELARIEGKESRGKSA